MWASVARIAVNGMPRFEGTDAQMLLSLGLILLCQLIGEAIAYGTGLPVPGPVIGLMLCVLLLAVRDRVGRVVPRELHDGTFERTGTGLLSHLSLLFIPAGVGVIQRLDVLAGNAVPILAALVVSTVLSLAVTAGVFSFVARRTQ
jgi:holin-like protein